MLWPSDKLELFELGKIRATQFCELNNLSVPTIRIAKEWPFSVCAYYRPERGTEHPRMPNGINLSIEKCQVPCGVAMSRLWTWPCSTVDREPFGVIAHEIGHHADWCISEQKGSYYGNYSIDIRAQSKEKPITSYCENDHEWFAEIFRVFITNPDLLRHLRPVTYELLLNKWKPVATGTWREELGENVPERVVKSLLNKGIKE